MKTGVRMPDHKPSSMLTQDENDQVFSLLGNRCLTLATTVVELYTTGGRQSGEWQLRETGVLCLVKDNPRRSYFFRLFCPLRKQLLWEHEVYNNMQYLAPTPFLHTFEAEDCITGFNFAHEGEGTFLREVLLEKLESKRQKRMERRSRNVNSIVGSPRPLAQQNGISAPPLPPMPRLTKKEAKRRITKADIGTPHNFRHVSHVGWDPNKGFDFDNIENPQLKEFLVKAGVSEKELQDRETREFIYDFILRNGGIEAVEGDLKPPPVPTRVRPPPPPPTRAPPALPPPPPPPPPPLRTLPPRNLPSNSSSSSLGSVGVEVPSPPPPPPPMSPPPQAAPQDDPRSTLLQQIRSGPTLKPVTAAPVETKKVVDSRGDLLDQIRQGVELKSVSPAPAGPRASPDNGLAGALARALACRSKAIHSDTSGSSDSELDDDEEWED